MQVGGLCPIDKDCHKYGTAPDQWAVITEVHPNADRSHIAVDFEILSCDADARAVSKYLVLLDEGKPMPDGVKSTYDRIIQASGPASRPSF